MHRTLKHTDIVSNGILSDLLDGGIADSSFGNVDYSLKCDVIFRIVNELQISENVLDLLTVIEPHSTVDPERNAEIMERRFYVT